MRRVAPAMSVILFGMITSSVFLFSITNLFQPVPAIVNLSFGDNSSLSTVSKSKVDIDPEMTPHSDRQPDERFAFIPRTDLDGILSITHAGRSKLSTGLQSIDAESAFGLSISAYADCPFWEIEALPRPKPLLFSYPVRQSNIVIDGGNSDIKSTVSGLVTLNAGDIQMFGISNSEKESERDISGFVTENTSVQYSSSDDIPYLIGTSLLKASGNRGLPSPVKFTLSIDDRTFDLSIHGDNTARTSDRLVCRPVALSVEDGNLILSERPRSYISLYIQPSREGAGQAYHSQAQTLRVEGINGWVALKNVPVSDIANTSMGGIQMMFAQSGMEHLEVGGRTVDVRPSDTLVTRGDQRIRIGDDGNFAVSGRADAIWRNDIRASLTRWELLSGEMRVGLVTALLASLATAITMLWRLVNSFGRTSPTQRFRF
ncbi:MAG: hypothetical protein Q7J26_09000 [Brevundimonas sp.]|uniref:hypothetical protein n=1 Tax=Brevundimonas sp. TaxID=1871086 RepID=UPI002721310F|nr:hypothetical protein [Brevundimonas sp.]MDO9608648.1 hypothetical protein [Brevundimonas sp.]